MRDYSEKRAAFKHLIYDSKILSMAVAPDALAAKIAEQTGFKAVFVAGYATSASTLGLPDRGILDFGQMLQKLKEIIDAVNIPVFVDGDTGYGDIENVARTVRCYEAAGAAGIFLEDQVWPKRCGHMAGKSVVPAAELAAKIKMASAARRHDDFLIMSRTDARQMNGLQNAIDRSKLYQHSGADMVFIEAPQSKAELATIAAEFPDTPLMANMIEDGATPMLPIEELEAMGYSFVVHPTALTYANAYADKAVLKELHDLGRTDKTKQHMVTFNDFNQLVGLDSLNDLEKRYSAQPMAAMINEIGL
ncbi:oxaloacetate decarboxylase [Lactobacillus sp. Sy-1]|uniref:isocitrate lyase/PEP mutase family protein n=1 Tax=Lactobacillus sp. Sy-1 TaxID=2109645 RepID=UPI001C5B8740|nr:isocitrate lyase/PEP mutase family protein [Lactobacillus sp. Sy-1]MBW1605867.1 isocitrate lyase/PEP mutase family protein [Lactobacillus sp. Sy-1]